MISIPVAASAAEALDKVAAPETPHSSLLSWAFDPTNAVAISGWGFWFGCVGLILTILGFGVTLIQLHRTRKAATAVSEEVERIRQSLNRYEMVNEAARASSHLVTARNYLRNNLWVSVGDSYEIVRDGLEALKSDAAELSDEQRTRIEAASAYIQNPCLRIERDRQKGRATIDAAKTIAVMTEHRLLLAEITRVIDKGVVK